MRTSKRDETLANDNIMILTVVTGVAILVKIKKVQIDVVQRDIYENHSSTRTVISSAIRAARTQMVECDLSSKSRYIEDRFLIT
jgi:Ca2+/Na+ antiporter